ncbi:MAG: nucleotide exchange factor GrpE [Patescibacteria group bacterium]|nr:nucleotide exchange factor GrpE [Patescibacteria group bacterium]
MNDENNITNEELEIRPEELESADFVTPEPLAEADDVEFVDTDSMGDELKDKAKLKNLREELKKVQIESRDNLTALQRSRADYVNLKKELDEVRETTKKKITEKVLGDFLPVLDSFDMAMGNQTAWEAVDKNWRMGVEYIYSQLKNTLENNSVEAIDKVGVDFDPNLHEPIETKETDDASLDHKIEKIIQKGYKMGERIIRPARVVVWKVQ